MVTFIEFQDLKGNPIVVNTGDIVFIQSSGRDAKLYIRNYNIFHHQITISIQEYERVKMLLSEMKCHHGHKKDY
jgi:hypothetical protein